MTNIQRAIGLVALLTLGLCMEATAAGQTSVPPAQLKGGVPGAPKLYMVLPTGKVAQILLGTGFILDTSVNPPVLNFTAPVVNTTSEITNVVLSGTFNAGSGKTTFRLPETPLAGSLKVFINGLKAVPVGDYNIVGGAVELVAGAGDMSDPNIHTISIDYRK